MSARLKDCIFFVVTVFFIKLGTCGADISDYASLLALPNGANLVNDFKELYSGCAPSDGTLACIGETLDLDHPDKDLDIVELVRKYRGVELECHEVVTDDGYILTLYRLRGNGEPLLLMHGILSSAADFVTPGPGHALAFLLADAGYDIWLGNARGNQYSQKHKWLSPSDDDFWDFCWEDIGYYDLPAIIDHILNVTQYKQVKYVGHSQGTTVFFVMCSMRPAYNEKIASMVAMSAIAWMSHIKSPLIRLLALVNPVLNIIADATGQFEVIANNGIIVNLKALACSVPLTADLVCNNILSLIVGFDPDQTNCEAVVVIYNHFPSRCSSKQFFHYTQEMNSGRFCRYDYGVIKNWIKYNSPEPPSYPVEKITAPVSVLQSEGDWLAADTDVNILLNKLPNVQDYYVVPLKKFNHLDYMYARDIKTLTLPRLLLNLAKYQCKK